MKARWLLHPESPGNRVLVVRTLWQWLIRPAEFATLDEVAIYYAFKDRLNE